MKKRGLGKGLDALFSSDEEILSTDTEAVPATEEETKDQNVQIVDIYMVEPDRNQPRKTFDAEKLQE